MAHSLRDNHTTPARQTLSAQHPKAQQNPQYDGDIPITDSSDLNDHPLTQSTHIQANPQLLRVISRLPRTQQQKTQTPTPRRSCRLQPIPKDTTKPDLSRTISLTTCHLHEQPFLQNPV
jgi:hypothetical protein